MKTRLGKYIPLVLGLSLAALLLVGCSCSKESADKDFLDSEELMLKVDGKVVLRYDEKTCQIAYSEDRKFFRVSTDDMTKYYQLNCQTLPYSQGQNIKATIRWSGGSSISTREDLSFHVEKVTEEGRFWLWCSAKNIGVSVQMIR